MKPATAPTSEADLEALMTAYQHGDRQAADALITRISPALHRFLAMQAGDRRHADDLLQDTWLRIHRARHTWRSGEPVLPWLYAIARHARIDSYRRRSWERHEQSVPQLPEPAVATQPGSRNLPDLDAMLAVLPDSQREVISMLKIGGLSIEEVARATSSSIGAVKQKAHRAYERLRVFLAERSAQ